MGYNSTNVYRIWNPATYTVKGYRDVIFDENKRYHAQAELPIRETEPHLQYVEIPLPDYLTAISDADDDLLSLLPSQRGRDSPGSNQPSFSKPSSTSKTTTPQVLTPPSTTALTPTSSRSQSQQPEPPEPVTAPEITTRTEQAPLDVLQSNVFRPRRLHGREDFSPTS